MEYEKFNQINLIRFRFGSQIKIYKSVISSNVQLGKHLSITESKISGNIKIGDYTSIADHAQILAKYDEINIGSRFNCPNVLIQNYSHNLNNKITNNNAFKNIYGNEALIRAIKET